MKKTLVTAVALAAVAGSPLLAQNAKESTITFSLTRQYQNSVSSSASVGNAGEWTDPPAFYKTKSAKLSTADVLKSIAIVLHGTPNYYSSQTKVVLVQGELSGFFGADETIVNAAAAGTTDVTAAGGVFDSTLFEGAVSSSTVSGQKVRFATGRHLVPNPDSGAWPPGLNQPWGQIFVKDPAKGTCENVTFFFSVQVQQCYDCFYLNSFISDASFKFRRTDGPPCCGSTIATTGSGKDRYYMTLSFDNTTVNPYLNPDSALWVGFADSRYEGVEGLFEIEDGVTPDALDYDSSILVSAAQDFHDYDVYVLRFALSGILSYNWSLKFVNSNDIYPDFVGSASFPVYGTGYVAKTCAMITGTVAIADKIAKASTCCLDLPWYDNWYGVGFDGGNGLEVPVNTALDLSFHAGVAAAPAE